MVFVVPYDRSPVAEAALRRAVEHGRAFDRDVLAVSYVPTGAEFAERRKWIEPADDFAIEGASAALKRKIEEATDETELVYRDATAGSPADGIGEAVRETATDVDASVVFVGIANGSADALETRFGSISTTASYDVHLVRGT
jgi:nucleotide-binding universal stress UspA family protein